MATLRLDFNSEEFPAKFWQDIKNHFSQAKGSLSTEDFQL